MSPDISDADQIPTLDDGPIPFETPQGHAPASPRPRKRKKKRTSLVALLALVYASGAIGIGAFDQGGWVLLAWLVTGPAVFGVVRAVRSGT